jgi:putative hydrolase of the HAD superfamily
MATKTLSQSIGAGINAITFDVGGTLIQPWPSAGHVYAEVAARHGLNNFSAEQLNARFKTAWRTRPAFAHSRNAWEELVSEVFGAPTPPGFFTELYGRFAEPDVWHIFDDVLPTLDALASRKIKLAVISNWDERLRPLLRSLRLDRYFETFAISIEVGFPKPSPVIFEHAAAKLGLPPGSILHIGDSPEMDIAGAQAAGFQALQIHRHSKKPVDSGIHSLAEMLAIIDKSQIR